MRGNDFDTAPQGLQGGQEAHMQNFFSTYRTRAFLYVWFGQLLSVVGSGMTSFVLAIWTYKQNASTAQFAIVVLAAALPSIIMAPFAGTLVDRWDSRKVMAWSVAGQAVSTFVLALLFFNGTNLVYWQIYPAVVVVALCGAFQGPALTTAGTALLPESLYSRATGLWQLNQAAVMIVSPIIAAAIMNIVSIGWIVVFDGLSYAFALLSLLSLREPIRAPAGPIAQTAGGGVLAKFFRDMGEGWRFIRMHRSLTHMLTFGLFVNLVYDVVQILALPLTVKEGTAGDLAWLMALSAAGMVVGSVVMAVWSGPRNNVTAIAVSALGVGLALVLAGLQKAPLALAACFFVFSLFIPLGQTASGALWMRKTQPAVLGRVTATTSMLVQMCFPLAVLIAPWLADEIFQPLLTGGGNWAVTLFGSGPQRGVGLLLSVVGILTVLFTVLAWLDPRIRRIDALMADVSHEALDHDDANAAENARIELPRAPSRRNDSTIEKEQT